MRLATLMHQGRPRVGRLSADGLHIELFDTPGERGALALVEQAAAGVPLPHVAESVPLAGAVFMAPLPRPRRNLFCVGRNYHAHAKELQGTVFKDNAKAVDAWPIVFTKVPETVVGPGADVHLPGAAISAQIDYEAELAIVIGKGGRNIAKADAPGAVFGWCVGNDVTERMWQHRTPQWSLGKSFDTHAPFGPWITTADEIADPHALGLRCLINGETRQNSNTRHLVFDVWAQIEHLSTAMTLEPGDVIFTGTPGGVGAAMDPRQFLRAGDVMRCEVDSMGHIEAVCEAV